MQRKESIAGSRLILTAFLSVAMVVVVGEVEVEVEVEVGDNGWESEVTLLLITKMIVT